ncbi:hypothetical protein [Sandarakinorhabdus limnophila]|jgi:hypothetical protein|nr:hypothetical protein [Sandarakinorhabdus limnophila]
MLIEALLLMGNSNLASSRNAPSPTRAHEVSFHIKRLHDEHVG